VIPRGRWIAAAATLAVLASGCAGLIPPQTPAVPPVTEMPAVVVTCGDDQVFSPELLTAVGEAQLGADPAAKALRAFLATPEGAALAAPSWVRVSESADRVQFLGRRANTDGWLVVGFFVHDQAWELDLAGECNPRVVLGAGLGPADWWVDPAGPPRTRETTELDVLVLERSCAGGESSDGRIAPPFVLYQADAVVLTFGVIPREGAQRCPSHPPGRYHVRLDEPLGDRWLLDGGVFPPRDATRPPAS
jgi:hypothetical protein